jgi:hypothetical protein
MPEALYVILRHRSLFQVQLLQQQEALEREVIQGASGFDFEC